MVLQLKDLFLMVLKRLDENNFAQFKTKLSTLEVKKKYKRIPSSQLEGADPESVIDLILEFYPQFYGITVIQAVLDAINRKELWNKVLDELKENGHFLDLYRSDLIECNNVRVDPILYYLHYLKLLTDEQYEELNKQPTYQEKMEGLLDTVRCWDNESKHHVIMALECYNPEVLKLRTDDRPQNFIKIGAVLYDSGFFTLRGRDIGKTKVSARMHFLEKYKEKLIKSIMMVDPVLDDLRDQQLLTQRQHKNLMQKATPREKMRSLFDTVRTWSYLDKETVYKALKKYNYGIIRDLLTQEGRFYDFSDDQIILRNHFLDRNQKELIEKITNVDPVLQDLLDQRLLTEQHYAKLREKPSSVEKMRSLCDTIYNWSYSNKNKVYDILRRHNYKELRTLELSYVPSLFFGDLSDIPPPDYLYIYGLPKAQGAFSEPEVKIKVPPFSSLEKEHFLDRHWSFLIQRIKFVDPVLFDLRYKMLITQEEFQNLISKSSSTDKMCELFGIIRSWDQRKKDLLYDAFWKYNDEEMSMLESQYQRKWNYVVFQSFTGLKTFEHSEYASATTTTSKPVYIPHITTQEFYVKKDVGVLSPHMECHLCGKFQDSGDVLTPDVFGNRLRLVLKSDGLFCCRKTGIKFQVNGPVVIEYSLESWSDYLEEIPGSKHEVIGPLFNIKIHQQSMVNAVSAVYLPHYLCLRSFTGDPSSIKCAHFTDGNMALKSPTRVEPFYIVMENPTFSCLGPLLSLVKKKTPIHGIVLIYFQIVCPGEPKYQEYKIHLHLLPLIPHIEERLDKDKVKLGFRRIAKPPQTNDTVYTKTKYLITSCPQDYVLPKTLKFQSSHHSGPYQFTEVSVTGKDINIFLEVKEESTTETVWDTILTRGDIKHLSRSVDPLRNKEGASSPPEHFVDKHRKALIERLPHVDPVLDDLLAHRLLTQEQYDNIRIREPPQEKMRKLYQYTTSWGNQDKEKLFQAILRCNKPLVIDLEGLQIAI